MTYQIRLNVKGASDESYAKAATQVLRNEGIEATLVRITRTSKGAVVTMQVVG